MRKPTRRAAGIAAAATLAATLVATTAPAQSAPTGQALADPHPRLSLVKAADAVELESYGRAVFLDLGIYAVAGDVPFEVRAHRPAYDQPIQAELVTPGAPATPLPDGMIQGFRGLSKFFHVQIRDRAGDLVVNRVTRFCPGFDPVRVRPDTPTDTATYPFDCPWNPYTVGAVYGVDPGFGVAAMGQYGTRVPLPPGRYTAKVWVAKPYRDLLGVSAADTTAQVRVHVVKGELECATVGCKAPVAAASTRSVAPRRTAVVPRRPAAHAPTAPTLVPSATAQPDLRSLPAYAIQLNKRGFLGFAATVWNAGPSPLVIDGFRRADEPIMDAYQYFYEADGTPAGHEAAGTMEWDDRSGHNHWHFRNFARYRLLDADKHNVVRSHKEAFCLANTDAVDYTVAGANWRPYNTDLHTSCGGFTSLSVREVLDTGSGDTYYQGLPGQSFNVKDLPNGRYFIAVEANPAGVLHEADTTNNVSYRKVLLRGSGDDRRVVVHQVGLVTEGIRF